MEGLILEVGVHYIQYFHTIASKHYGWNEIKCTYIQNLAQHIHNTSRNEPQVKSSINNSEE